MFPIEDLTGITSLPQFLEDRKVVLRALAADRVGQQELFSKDAIGRLSHFVECVLASAPDWDLASPNDLCRVSAEIAEALSIAVESEIAKRKMRLRSALLFELADLPAISSALLEDVSLAHAVSDFFTRRGLFGTLRNQASGSYQNGASSLVELALASDARATGEYIQGRMEHASTRAARLFTSLASEVALDYSASEIRAFEIALKRRAERATRNHVSATLFDELKTDGYLLDSGDHNL